MMLIFTCLRYCEIIVTFLAGSQTTSSSPGAPSITTTSCPLCQKQPPGWPHPPFPSGRQNWKTQAAIFKQAGHTRTRLEFLWGRDFLFRSQHSTLPTCLVSKYYSNRKVLIILLLLRSVKGLCIKIYTFPCHFCLFFFKAPCTYMNMGTYTQCYISVA